MATFTAAMKEARFGIGLRERQDGWIYHFSAASVGGY